MIIDHGISIKLINYSTTYIYIYIYIYICINDTFLHLIESIYKVARNKVI